MTNKDTNQQAEQALRQEAEKIREQVLIEPYVGPNRARTTKEIAIETAIRLALSPSVRDYHSPKKETKRSEEGSCYKTQIVEEAWDFIKRTALVQGKGLDGATFSCQQVIRALNKMDEKLSVQLERSAELLKEKEGDLQLEVELNVIAKKRVYYLEADLSESQRRVEELEQQLKNK